MARTDHSLPRSKRSGIRGKPEVLDAADRERLAHGPPISRAVEDGVRAVVENHKIAARDQRKILYLVTWQRDLDATRAAADNESATTNLMQWREEC